MGTRARFHSLLMALGFCLCFQSHAGPLSVCLIPPPSPPAPSQTRYHPNSARQHTSCRGYIMPWIFYQVSLARQPRDRL
eukprot:1057143-Amorphochlora_amoeboformis.AAC.1